MHLPQGLETKENDLVICAYILYMCLLFQIASDPFASCICHKFKVIGDSPHVNMHTAPLSCYAIMAWTLRWVHCMLGCGCPKPATWLMCINSLWPSDAIWRQRSGSTLAQVMACCLMAPSHYLNQFWLIISKVLWHSWEGITMRRSEHTNQYNKIENYIFRIAFRFPRGQWVNKWWNS